jgi:hypothetical protein
VIARRYFVDASSASLSRHASHFPHIQSIQTG